MATVAVVTGLVASAVVLSALLVLCAMRRKGASVPTRRGAPYGAPQIDPILQPEWASKQAALEELEKKKQTFYMPSKQARSQKAAGGGRGDKEQLHVVMRQPSTLADKFALPSHLSKQLGQSSKRGCALAGGGGTLSQDASADILPDGKSQSMSLQRSDWVDYSSLPPNASRNAAHDSINVHPFARSQPHEMLYSQRQPYSRTSTSDSHRKLGTAVYLASSPGSESVSATVVPVSAMYVPLNDSRNVAELQASGTAIGSEEFAGPSYSGPSCRGTGIETTWAGVTDVGANGDHSPDFSTQRQLIAPSPLPRQLGDGPWVSNGRGAVLSSSHPASSRPESRELSDADSNRERRRLRNQCFQEESFEDDEQRRQIASDAVESLVKGVDCSMAAAAAAGEEMSGASEGHGCIRKLGTVSSRDLRVRPTHLPSSLTGGYASVGVSGGSGIKAFLEGRELRRSGSGTSKRWTGSGTVPPPLLALLPEDLEAQLPGSADNTVHGLAAADGRMLHSQRSFLVMRGCGDGEGPYNMRALGQSCSGQSRSASISSVGFTQLVTKPGFTSGGGGGSGSSSSATPRNVTWSGMTVAKLVDVAAGPAASIASYVGDGSMASTPSSGSRTARAQALLMRNRSNLSRLAAVNAARYSTVGADDSAVVDA